MNDQESARYRSPFSELSFSEQQEKWRMWRAQSLEYQEIKPNPQPAAPVSPSIPAPRPFAPPSHKNLDQVRARISAAAARAGAFKSLT